MRMISPRPMTLRWLTLVLLVLASLSAAAQTLVLTHPNGRERFAGGDTITIEWQSLTPFEPTRLSYSSDGGGTWSTIAERALGGSHRWVVPSAPTGDALVRVERWRPDSVVTVRDLPRVRGAFKGAIVTPDGRSVVIAILLPGHPSDSEVHIVDARTLEVVARRVFRGRSIFDIDASHDGRLLYVATLASSANDTSVVVLDASNAAVVGGMRGHVAGASSIDASEDGSMIATGGYDPTIRIWDPESLQQSMLLEGFSGSVGQVAFDRAGRYLAAASASEKTLHVYETDTWTQRFELATDSAGTQLGEVRDLEFTPDGRRLLSVSYPYGISIFDAESGRQLLRRAVAPGTSLAAMSPDGRIVASGRDTVHVWDAATGTTLFTLPRPLPGLAQLAFSPDGAELLTLGRDSTPRLWLLGGPVVESDRSDNTFGIDMAASVGGESERRIAGVSVVPSSDRIVVHVDDPKVVVRDVVVVDALGRRVAAEGIRAGRGAISIDATRLSNGVYFILVGTDHGTIAAPVHWRR